MIMITEIETPIGKMTACAVETGVCLLEFSDRRGLQAEIASLARKWKSNTQQIAQVEHQLQTTHLENLRIQLSGYFSGERKEFTVPVVLSGTEFQQKTWQALQTIPYGTTVTYKEQAVRLLMPDSVRAIANANALNSCLIIVPCHRVIGTSGSLTGYKGDLWRKRFLLDLERKHAGMKKGQQVIEFGE